MNQEIDAVEVKKAINNLLWSYLPGSVTLEEAERIALSWLEGIMKIRRARDVGNRD